MSDSENDRKRELEFLRLASDLTQLATETLNPDLKAHCLRMASRLTDQAEQGPIENIPLQNISYHWCNGGIAWQIATRCSDREDDPLLRMLAVEVVEEADFVTLETGNADEAVSLLESRPDISLLFTDIDLPGSMDGLKLACAVRDRWPPIKILIVSGKVQVHSSELPSNSCFVGKPYQTAAMVAELRSLVGSL